MHPFTLERPRDVATAMMLGARGAPATEYIAGGTDMLPLLKDEVLRPERLVAVGAGVLDDRIELGRDGTLRIGAAARMTDVADHEGVGETFPLIAQALLAGASPQVRNMATLGGNLLQRTRCGYFRDVGVVACNKRRPGSGCAAMDGDNRMHAVLGGSDQCIATHASDVAVALVALDARLRLRSLDGERIVALEAFHRVPGDAPQVETVLAPGELIAAIEVPAGAALARRSHYLKVRDRVSFEFALVSAAVALDVEDGRIRMARVAMGGVGTKPWRMPRVEQALAGARCDGTAYRAAAERATDGAVPRGRNGFKLDLMVRTLVRALEIAGGQA
ncbi:MAG: FAD-binding molybdopterin dehydrogenase [Candidatus Rokubacteria bacterium 13_1_40CM_68_15]|nr:MAG: FAD-binding molybdopterin dehydrogenase [Candidatus Rokubacteria bacterium 13_1_40CM_68_15]